MNDIPELQTLDGAKTGIYTIGKSLSLPVPPVLGWNWEGVPHVIVSVSRIEQCVMVQYQNGDNYSFLRALTGECNYVGAICAGGKEFKRLGDMWHEVDKSLEVGPNIRRQVEHVLKEKGLI